VPAGGGTESLRSPGRVPLKEDVGGADPRDRLHCGSDAIKDDASGWTGGRGEGEGNIDGRAVDLDTEHKAKISDWKAILRIKDA